jgi:heme-degrading monooxygenase HmoA
MHARVVRVKGSPEGAEERAATFQREALPVIREQPGFSGVVTLGDPDGGLGAVVTYWESGEAMAASAEALTALRERMTAGQGLEVITVEEFEITMLERRAAPEPGNAVRVTRADGNPDASEAAVTQLREEGLALAQTLQGFRALISGVDRSTGRFMIASGWDTAADRDASEQATAELRARLAEVAGATNLEVDKLEVTFAEIPAGVTS